MIHEKFEILKFYLFYFNSYISRHQDYIKTSRHQDIKTSRHQDIKTSRHQDIKGRVGKYRMASFGGYSYSSSSSGEQKLPECALQGCTKDVFVDKRTGIQHDYCGRTHAKQDGNNVSVPHGICHTCKLDGCEKNVYYDEETGRVHDFCGLTHARMALKSGEWKVADKRPQKKLRNRGGSGSNSSSSSSSSSGGGGSSTGRTCSLFGCSAPVWEDPTNNKKYDYCSRDHADVARERGELPSGDENIARSFAGSSNRGHWSLNLLKNTHPKWAQVRHQFLQKWEKPTSVQVVRIYQIRNPPEVFQAFTSCACDLGEDTVVRRFHGTSVQCDVGVNPNSGPCNSSTCALCNIMRVGFSLDFVNSRSGGPALSWLRYGPGLYFSQCSGKSNDYTGTKAMKPGPRGTLSVPHRSMLLCKVALGRNKETIYDEPNLTKEALNQEGFDSISGKVQEGGLGTLNFPEDVVFNSEAAIPSYLISYCIYDQ
jgi:hypothetical protein